MARARAATETVRVSMRVTPAQKRELIRRARDSGQSVSAYVLERVLAHADCEEEVFRFMAEELSAIASRAKEVMKPDVVLAGEAVELPDERDQRIAAEVRASLTVEDVEALRRLFAPTIVKR